MSQKIKTASLGFSRIGLNRELKFALEKFWANKISYQELEKTAKEIRLQNWQAQNKLYFIPSGDFSYYDHVLDLSVEFNNIPKKFDVINDEVEKYFALARGYQKNGLDFHALELSKWFNTNYHYVVPEFHDDIELKYRPQKFVAHFLEAKSYGLNTRPVIIGPVSYLLLGKEKTANKKDILPKLLSCYIDLLNDLKANGCRDVQIDEPFLATEISDEVRELYKKSFSKLAKVGLNLHLVTYFDELKENTQLAFDLDVTSIHFDVSEFDLPKLPVSDKTISIGIVNGRNIWKNNLAKSVELLKSLANRDIIIATSCSLLHVPVSLNAENKFEGELKDRLAYGLEKIEEISLLKEILDGEKQLENFKFPNPPKPNELVAEKLLNLPKNINRKSKFLERQKEQKSLALPLFPTTTIGSFPQSEEVRKNRADFKKGLKTEAQYNEFCRSEIANCIKYQEELELDVLVHGEFERNDMVEYFGENFAGFAFSQNGWVQSYGSRCVKPPIIFADVSRTKPITVEWSKYAQSLTSRPVKGMLTGPVTILKWSFVRDDISLEASCKQIAIALQEEVLDLEKAGINIIQIDEPAIREILPLRKSKWNEFLTWAVDAFKISCLGVEDKTQIHTHMCYSEFNDIIDHILRLDADVISIEASRSDLEVLLALKNFNYSNDIGPGVWDIHSPRIPSVDEIRAVIEKSLQYLKPQQVWVNPDCGLKTRGITEVIASLKNLVAVAKEFREKFEG